MPSASGTGRAGIQAEFHESLVHRFLPLARLPRLLFCHQAHARSRALLTSSSALLRPIAVQSRDPQLLVGEESDSQADRVMEAAVLRRFRGVTLHGRGFAKPLLRAECRAAHRGEHRSPPPLTSAA